MSTATIGTRYQVVIPREEREKLGIQPGDKVAVDVVEDRIELHVIDARKLRGLGKGLKASKNPVSYVTELRAEWGKRQA